MKNRILKSTTFKLICLLIIILIAFVSSSFVFNKQIDELKNQIDKMYYGNLLPIIKLGVISDNYKKIISCRTMKYICDFKKEKKIIEKEWKFYNNSYKNSQERILIESIDLQIADAFKENKLYKFKDALKQIKFLMNYETKFAENEMEVFIEEYDSMKLYSYISMFFIVLISLAIIIPILYQIIKKDSQLRVLNKQYKLDSITDSMTKLYNRKYFDEIFDSMPFIANERNWECTFIIIDIDYFKQYNDTYGHDMGDKALKTVSTCLQSFFSKKYEFVFRLGGEEFGVILFDTKEDIIKSCLAEINKKILELNIEHQSSKILDIISISIGAVTYEPNSYISANKLYKMADECLYKSKQNGRNQYHYIKGLEE